MPNVKEVLRDAERAIRASDHLDLSPSKAREDAEELLRFVLGRAPNPKAGLREDSARRFQRLVRRHVAGEPVAYMTGEIEFLGMTLEVRRGVFIPRITTEFLAQQAIRRLRRRTRPVHVDLATGIGPVPLAVARNVKQSRVFGVDVSPRPLALATKNARRLRLRNVTFLRGDLYAPLPGDLGGMVDAITMHPPYVRRTEVRELADEIKKFEPIESLTDQSRTGLRLLERATAEAPDWLKPGGWLLVEVSSDRSRKVAGLMRDAGLREVRSTKGDLPWNRVVVGRRP